MSTDSAQTERELLLMACEALRQKLEHSLPVSQELIPKGVFVTPFFNELWLDVEDAFEHMPRLPMKHGKADRGANSYDEHQEKRLTIIVACEILKYDRPPDLLKKIYQEVYWRPGLNAENAAEFVRDTIAELT